VHDCHYDYFRFSYTIDQCERKPLKQTAPETRAEHSPGVRPFACPGKRGIVGIKELEAQSDPALFIESNSFPQFFLCRGNEPDLHPE
jgi:hypothetical protein